MQSSCTQKPGNANKILKSKNIQMKNGVDDDRDVGRRISTFVCQNVYTKFQWEMTTTTTNRGEAVSRANGDAWHRSRLNCNHSVLRNAIAGLNTNTRLHFSRLLLSRYLLFERRRRFVISLECFWLSASHICAPAVHILL